MILRKRLIGALAVGTAMMALVTPAMAVADPPVPTVDGSYNACSEAADFKSNYLHELRSGQIEGVSFFVYTHLTRTETWLCVGVSGTGMRVVLPGTVLVGPPVWDANAAACSATPDNQIPGTHPIIYSQGGAPLYDRESLDAYMDGTQLWLCVELATANWQLPQRLVLSLS